MSLLKDVHRNPITLVLGAGVSASAGIPNWRELLIKVCSSFYAHWEFDCELERLSKYTPPTDLSIVFTEEIFWSDTSKEFAKKFTEKDFCICIAT